MVKEKNACVSAAGQSARTNISWGLMAVVAASEFNTFRHLVSYPDVTSYTPGLARRAAPQGMM